MFYPTRALASLALGLAAPILPSLAQEPPAQEGAPRSADVEDLLLASDGQPAAPGRIPSDTPEADAQRWRKLAEILTGKTRPSGPAAFELAASVRYRDETGSKDFNARFGYLEDGEGYVRMKVVDDDGSTRVVQMRGPDPKRAGRLAYWFRKDQGEGKTDGWVLQSGVEAANDRRTLDRFAAASYDIARVVDPNSMRIVRVRGLQRAADYDPKVGFLKLGGDAGVQLPDVDVFGKQGGRDERIFELAARLDWIELGTPDFRIFETDLSRSERRRLRRSVKRVVFGVDPKTGRPNLILVSPLANGQLQAPGSVLLQCSDWYPQFDEPDTVLPGFFFAYETVASKASPTGLAFALTSSADLAVLDGSTLRAKLTSADFVGN